MSNSRLNTRHRSTAFLNRVFTFFVVWVISSIGGGQYYIFHLESKNEIIEQKVFSVESTLNSLDLALISYTNNEIAFDKIEALKALLQAELTELAPSNTDGAFALQVPISAFKDNSASNYQTEIITLRKQLLDAKQSYNQKHNVVIERIKRFFIGFGIFTFVFLLLALSAIRKRLTTNYSTKNTYEQSDTEEYLTFTEQWGGHSQFYHKVFLYSCFQRMEEPCLILNEMREVCYANQVFSAMWDNDQSLLTQALTGHDMPVELKKMSIAAFDDIDKKKIHINGLVYSVSEAAIWDGSSIIGYEVKLLVVSNILEYEVLSKNISLMAQDVWDAPVRVLREGSSAAGIAVQLEAIRLKVQWLFDEINALSEAPGLVQTKKLQHIVTLFQDIKAGDFDFGFNHQDVLKLSDKWRNQLAVMPEEARLDIKMLVEDLYQRCELILSDGTEEFDINDFVNRIKNNLQTFSNSQTEEEHSIKKLSSNLLVLEDALRHLHEAKEVTLNAMNEGQYEQDEVDFKKFFIDDVDHQLSSVIRMLEKAVLTKKSALAFSEATLSNSKSAVAEMSISCSQSFSSAKDTDELIDQVRFLAQGLSVFDQKIQSEENPVKSKPAYEKVGDTEENGDW